MTVRIGITSVDVMLKAKLDRRSSVFLLVVVCCTLLHICRPATSTEITELSSTVDQSLGFRINLPLLMCHSKQIGYKQVRWYKDYILVKKGSSSMSDHVLSLSKLVNSSSYDFEHPLKLQGYYWCRTDNSSSTTVHKHLFRIKGVSTFVGNLHSTEDSYGEENELSPEEKFFLKRTIYQDEMQEFLFGFLPQPNTHVTDIVQREDGLQVYFYLYARQNLHPRQPFDSALVADKHEIEHVIESLENAPGALDEDLHELMVNWTDFRGISLKNIEMSSTLGCYEEKTLIPADPPQEITWPYARIGEVVIPDEACSSHSGLAVTRLCGGSFYAGAKWLSASGICDAPPNELTSELKSLHATFGDKPKPEYIRKLKNLTANAEQLTVTDAHIVIEILTQLSRVKDLTEEDITGIFSVIDDMVETNRSELMASKSTIRLTNRILRVMNNIFRQATQEQKNFLISKEHLLVNSQDTKVAGKVNRIVGVSVLSSGKRHTLVNGSVSFLKNGTKSPHHESVAYFLLPADLVMKRELDSLSCQVDMVFFKEWLLFPNPKEVLVKRNYKVLPTPVLYVSLTGGPAWNITDPVQIYFRDIYKQEIENPVCVHYDPRLENGDGGWSSEGCEFGGLKREFYNCRCHHLSIFAVILSRSPGSASRYRLGTAVYVGSGVSILALSFTVVLYLLSKTWRSTVDQTILFWQALSFLCFLILLFVSEAHFRRKSSCFVLALLLHYMVLVTFCWLLVQAFLYRLRFAKKTDVSEIPYFIPKAAICAWGAPAVIIIIIWITKEYDVYGKDNCWKIVAIVTRAAVIPTVILLLATLCVILCAVYAVTCRFKKDFLIGNSTYNESALKFRVAVTIYICYVASWLFGLFALMERKKELRVLFSISITLTAYYVTLFFVFHEISFWDLCCKKKEPSHNAVKYEAKGYEGTEDKDKPATN